MENNSKKGTGKLVAAFFISIIIAVLIGAGGLLLLFHFFPDFARDTVTNITQTQKEVTVTDTGIADAVEKVYDSVVIVETYQRKSLASTGTGFTYKKDGNTYYMLTNYHVIEGGDSVKVLFTSGEKVTATVVGGDKYADIAVLSYQSDKELAVSEIGSTADMRVGDTVFAIGAPLDSSVYSWTVTRGILSGKDRQVEVSTSNSNSSDWIMQVLQTDAAINSGNSGGPLCNSNGQVIGITNMKLVTTGVEGMGFAIPIEEATTYADAIINGEDLSRPYMGIGMADASNQYAASYYGYDTGVVGVLLTEVEAQSPADKAGLKEGDIIVGLGEEEITSVANLRYKLYKYKAGDTVSVKYIRDGKKSSTDITLIAAN